MNFGINGAFWALRLKNGVIRVFLFDLLFTTILSYKKLELRGYELNKAGKKNLQKYQTDVIALS